MRRPGPIVVIGAGIAGIATAAALARRGREVIVLERERVAGAGSTGRNAAIFRLAVAEPVNVALALESRAIGDRLVPGGTVRSTGALYPCDELQRECILHASAHAGVRDARPGDVPALLRGAGPMLFSPDDGVIDVHALLQALLREAVRHGAVVQYATEVRALERSAGEVAGVLTGRGRIDADVVVDATGAFSPRLPGACESDVGIRPYRRHLFVLETPEAARFSAVLWDLARSYYVRPESGGLLASACDETFMHAADDVPVDAAVAELLSAKLTAAIPELAGATVRRCWAGLRPLTADHQFVVGPDPRIAGLFRVGGFGGHGMTAGAAAGEVAAALLCGEAHALAAELSPSRASLHDGRDQGENA